MPAWLIASLLLGVSTNVDNLAVGAAYGVKRVRIGLAANLLIAFFNAAGTFLSMSAGRTVAGFFPESLGGTIGAGVIILVGLWGLFDAWRANDYPDEKQNAVIEMFCVGYICRYPDVLDVDHSRRIEFKEAFPLAMGLTITNLATGIGAGLAGLNTGFLTAVMFVFSMLGIWFGYGLGKTFSVFLTGKWPDIISGILLIGVGLYEVIS